MSATAVSVADQKGMRTLRMLIVAAFAMVVIAAGSGLVMLVAEPDSGSGLEAVLGITAAVTGLLTAVFVIAAAIYAQAKGLWKYAPMWIRVAASIFIVIGIVVTVWNLITQVF